MNITENSDSPKYNNTGYYLTPDLSQRLDLISHLLANTQLIPFVQAAEGCGKTRLTHHLKEILGERYTVFLIEGESGISLKSLRSQLSEATGAAAHEVIDDEQLVRQIKALQEQNKTLLILVDDAEQLPAETLAWLVEITSTQNGVFFGKCVIFAAVDVLALPLSPVLLSTLNDSIQTLDIPHITAEQLPGFVASVDPLKSAVIDETQYAALMKNSSGIIGKILWQLQYIDNIPIPQQESEDASSNIMKPLYIVAGILFVSALVSVLIFQDEINLSMSETKPEVQEDQLEVINLPLPPPVVAFQEKEERPEQENNPPKQYQLSEPEPEKEALNSKEPEPLHIAVSAPQETAEEQAAVGGLVSEADIEAEAKIDAEAQPVEVSAEGENKLKVEPEIKPGQTTKLQQDDNPPAVSKETEIAVSVKETKESEPKKLPLPKSEPVVPVKQQQKQREVLQPVDWIVNQPDKSYTLQLLGVSEEKGIKRFLKQHKFRGNFVILKTKRNGKPWFALLFETYASRDEALNARKNLPKSYKSSSAWPRSILSIRQAIEAN